MVNRFYLHCNPDQTNVMYPLKITSYCFLFSLGLFYMGSAKNDSASLCKVDIPNFQTQEKYTISGYVTENGSKENLLGVSVYVPELKLGTTTNDYGFFSLTLPEGQHDVLISYIGYAMQQRQSTCRKISFGTFPLIPLQDHWTKLP